MCLGAHREVHALNDNINSCLCSCLVYMLKFLGEWKPNILEKLSNNYQLEKKNFIVEQYSAKPYSKF